MTSYVSRWSHIVQTTVLSPRETLPSMSPRMVLGRAYSPLPSPTSPRVKSDPLLGLVDLKNVDERGVDRETVNPAEDVIYVDARNVDSAAEAANPQNDVQLVRSPTIPRGINLQPANNDVDVETSRYDLPATPRHHITEIPPENSGTDYSPLITPRDRLVHTIFVDKHTVDNSETSGSSGKIKATVENVDTSDSNTNVRDAAVDISEHTDTSHHDTTEEDVRNVDKSEEEYSDDFETTEAEDKNVDNSKSEEEYPDDIVDKSETERKETECYVHSDVDGVENVDINPKPHSEVDDVYMTSSSHINVDSAENTAARAEASVDESASSPQPKAEDLDDVQDTHVTDDVITRQRRDVSNREGGELSEQLFHRVDVSSQDDTDTDSLSVEELDSDVRLFP